MPEIIQNWLGMTLGVVLDMSPEKFGRNTKDGKLLAQVLYNYGVIPVDALNKVKASQNYYECYNNLVLLKPWLKHIGVAHDDLILQRMAGGEGSAAISVFYAVYLNLNRKDRLHYLSAQKERKQSEDSCRKFKVNRIPEMCISRKSGELTSDFRAFFEKRDMVEWHKTKCKQVVEHIKRTQTKFQKTIRKKQELGPLVSKHVTSQPLDKAETEAEETRGNINAFEKNHPQENLNLNYSELVELQNMYEMQPCVTPNMLEAKNIVSNLKRRRKGDIHARNFQQKMQHMLLDEQWKEVVEKENKDFENVVCANLLKQSQYEKQMAQKLYLIRNHKKVLAENRKKIECLKVDQFQKDYDEAVQRDVEMRGEYLEVEQLEKERIAELHRRLYDEKARRRRENIKIDCRNIFEALIEIAIRICEVRELIGCQVPKIFMKDLKELFFKGLPIFDLFDHFEELYDSEIQPYMALASEGVGEDEGVFYENSELKRLKCEEMERQNVLDECDFNDYINLSGPWMVELLFPNGSVTEVKHLVLGYIVHKLLDVKYPPPNVSIRVDIKPMKPTSVVQGLFDETATNMFIDLMEACKILVVRVKDAINFVLSAYKEELSEVRHIDLIFQKVTQDALGERRPSVKEKETKKKMQLLKKESAEESPFEDEKVHKEIQTPKMIPDDDPHLSANAELGKMAFEALGAGDPVPDTIIIPAVVAYVFSKQKNYNGWVLLNYPLLYSQASELEFCLTGFRLLPVIDAMETLEEAEGFTYRGPWADHISKDVLSENRMSRLVPKPNLFCVEETPIPKTYFDSFIKVRKVPETPQRRSQDFEDIDTLEKFYSDLEIFITFEYKNLNFETIKNLGKAIVKGKDWQGSTESWGVDQKNSVEVFGNAVLELNEKWGSRRRSTRETARGTRKAVKEPLLNCNLKVIGEGGEEKKEIYGYEKSEVLEAQAPSPKPGDPSWEWTTGSQPEALLLALASLWENMEAVYIEDLKKLFFTLRVHRSNVRNYCGFIRKSIRSLMRRPDEKQKVLSDFQQAFNEIDEDLRSDADIKCELHVRVSELEHALMGIADDRKSKSVKDVTFVAQDGWVADEIANLVNIFLSVLQLEADRCIDSFQVIMDYYICLQRKAPEEKQIAKVSVPKLIIQNQKYSILSNSSHKTASSSSPRNSDLKRSTKSLSDQGSKLTQDRSVKTRSLTDKRKRSSERSMVGAAEFISGILTSLRLPEDGLTPFHCFFIDTVQIIANEIKVISEGCFFEVKKNDKPAPSANRLTKSTKVSETKVVSSNDNLIAEWTTALENEISRFLFRTQLILARGVFEMNEFLTTILNILSSLMEEATELYMKEIRSISECCKVFKCGIEKEVPIKPILELKGDEFIVHMDEIDPNDEEFVDLTGESNDNKRFRFTIEQLTLLFDKLQKVAPDGEIIKRSLVFIIQDLRMLKSEVENCFPEIWDDIEPDDVTMIMNEVYLDLEIVPWKDFIIYALDLPLPTELDILTMRTAFRKLDPLVTELLSLENYLSVTFWFEDQEGLDCDEKERIEKAKQLLYRMYQVDENQTNYSAFLLAFCKDPNPVLGFTKALALAMGKMITLVEEIEPPSTLFMGEDEYFECEVFDTSTQKSYKKRVCCRTSSTDETLKCIPKEKIVRCECKDDSKTSVEESVDEEKSSLVDIEGEDRRYFYHDSQPYRQSSFASTIPYNILSSLLKASFPSLPQLCILLDCEQTFNDTLNWIYDSLESFDNSVEVGKLINHQFIHQLLHCTNKFKFVKLKPILLSVAKPKSPKSRVICVTEKPNFSCCLRK